MKIVKEVYSHSVYVIKLNVDTEETILGRGYTKETPILRYNKYCDNWTSRVQL